MMQRGRDATTMPSMSVSGSAKYSLPPSGSARECRFMVRNSPPHNQDPARSRVLTGGEPGGASVRAAPLVRSWGSLLVDCREPEPALALQRLAVSGRTGPGPRGAPFGTLTVYPVAFADTSIEREDVRPREELGRV